MSALKRAQRDWATTRVRVGFLSACWLVLAHALDAWSAGHGVLLAVLLILLGVASIVAGFRASSSYDDLVKAEREEAAAEAREREAVLASLREGEASAEGVDLPRVRVATPAPGVRLARWSYAAPGALSAEVEGHEMLYVWSPRSYAYTPAGWSKSNKPLTPGSPLCALLEKARTERERAEAAKLHAEEQLEYNAAYEKARKANGI